MQHWYAHHSEKAMGRPYPKLAEPRFYVTKRHASLQPGDWVWVVEGDLRAPTRFSLADCFEVSSIKPDPFPGTASKFKFELQGRSSKLAFNYGLNRADEWFAQLHHMYLSRGIPFNRLDNFPKVIEGLKRTCGLAP